ncbi:MAG: hypothetical protein ABFD18_14165, partial [Syntrophomonas sp.]
RKLAFPCDDLIQEYDPACTLYRGITIKAPVGLVFQWVSQLRIAPYSYDWIDNGGKPSPRRIIPDLPPVEIGQAVMGHFEIVDFQIDESITIEATAAGHSKYQLKALVVSYLIKPQDEKYCRLLVKGLMKFRKNPAARIMKRLIPRLDLIMMRKQFLNIKMLAEREGEDSWKQANIIPLDQDAPERNI